MDALLIDAAPTSFVHAAWSRAQRHAFVARSGFEQHEQLVAEAGKFRGDEPNAFPAELSGGSRVRGFALKCRALNGDAANAVASSKANVDVARHVARREHPVEESLAAGAQRTIFPGAKAFAEQNKKSVIISALAKRMPKQMSRPSCAKPGQPLKT
jgi:hypothetical protein